MNSRNIRITAGLLGGGALGILIVRALFLDPLEQLGWTMFWRGLEEGESMNWEAVLQSATFLKCLMGFVLFGVAGGVGVYLKGKRGIPQAATISTPARSPIDWKTIRSHASSRRAKSALKAMVIAIAVLAAIKVGAVLVHVARRAFISQSKKEIPRLFPVCDRCGTKDARWGFIDSTGRLAINFQFEEVDDFSEGLAAAKTGNRWGFVDEAGTFAINPQFEKVGSFAEGLAAVEVDYQWGYVDKTGKYAINPQFNAAGMFSEGVAMVMAGGKWGYVDDDGKYTIKPQFDDAWRFSDGLAAVKIGDKWGYISKKGKYLINPQFDETSSTFSDSLSPFRIGDRWGYIDEDGKYVINPQFDSAGKFSEGLAAVQTGEKWGYVDRKGKFAVNPQFAKAEDFSEGFAAVKAGDKWGFIDKTGKIVVNAQFNASSVGVFRRGLAMIAPNLYINAKAEWVWPNHELFQSDFAQIEPLLSADRPSGTENDGAWVQCANNIATRPLCFTSRKGDATDYGKALFHDRKAAQIAAKLQFDELAFENEHGRTLFAMKPTAEGWVPYPGIPTEPFMLETMPDLPSLPDAGNAANGTPVTPLSAQVPNQ